MKTILASITSPNLPPSPASRLVVFSGSDPHTIRTRDTQTFLAHAIGYAKNYQVFLVPGLYVRENLLCLCLLDDTGRMVIEQAAAHLNRSWAGDLQRADEICVARTLFGRVGLLVDVDVYKPEVARIAALQGAEILVSCQYLRPEDESREMVLAGAWQEGQQNCLYLLNSTNLHASIIGPCETSADRSGFLVDVSRELPIQAELSAGKRAAAYRSFPIFRSLHPALYRRHAEELRR